MCTIVLSSIKSFNMDCNLKKSDNFELTKSVCESKWAIYRMEKYIELKLCPEMEHTFYEE